MCYGFVVEASVLQFNLVTIFFPAGAGGGEGRSALLEVPKPGSFQFPHADCDGSLLRLCYYTELLKPEAARSQGHCGLSPGQGRGLWATRVSEAGGDLASPNSPGAPRRVSYSTLQLGGDANVPVSWAPHPPGFSPRPRGRRRHCETSQF